MCGVQGILKKIRINEHCLLTVSRVIPFKYEIIYTKEEIHYVLNMYVNDYIMFIIFSTVFKAELTPVVTIATVDSTSKLIVIFLFLLIPTTHMKFCKNLRPCVPRSFVHSLVLTESSY